MNKTFNEKMSLSLLDENDYIDMNNKQFAALNKKDVFKISSN